MRPKITYRVCADLMPDDEQDGRAAMADTIRRVVPLCTHCVSERRLNDWNPVKMSGPLQAVLFDMASARHFGNG